MTLIRANNRTLTDVTAAGIPKTSGQTIQAVMGDQDGTTRTYTGTTAQATAYRVTITPTSTSSKILILYHVTCSMNYSHQNNELSIYRSINGGSYTKVEEIANPMGEYSNPAYTEQVGGFVYDSPATTDSVTYKIYAQHGYDSSRNIYLNYNTNYGNNGSTSIMAFEVAG